MKKKFTLFLALVAMLCMLVGCAGTGNVSRSNNGEVNGTNAAGENPVGDAADDVTDAVKRGAKDVTDAVKRGMEDVTDAVRNGMDAMKRGTGMGEMN